MKLLLVLLLLASGCAMDAGPIPMEDPLLQECAPTLRARCASIPAEAEIYYFRSGVWHVADALRTRRLDGAAVLGSRGARRALEVACSQDQTQPFPAVDCGEGWTQIREEAFNAIYRLAAVQR